MKLVSPEFSSLLTVFTYKNRGGGVKLKVNLFLFNEGFPNDHEFDNLKYFKF